MPLREWLNGYYFGNKSLYPLGSIHYCTWKDLTGFVQVLWYEEREYTTTQKFTVVAVQRLTDHKRETLNQGYLQDFPDDRVS